MAVVLNWFDDAQTVLLFKFYDPWTWQEFQQANMRAAQLATQSHHTVHAIFDVRDASILSVSLFPFFSVAKQTVTATNQGITFICGALDSQSILHRLAASIMQTIPAMKGRITFVDTPVEALQNIAETSATV